MMPDMEKVIKEYEEFVDKYECFSSSDDYVLQMHKAVLALLKEQPKECKSCGTVFDIAYKAGKESIVRCKDCKHGGCRTQNLDGSIFRVVCKKHSTKKNDLWMDADWFCADGEMKDNG